MSNKNGFEQAPPTGRADKVLPAVEERAPELSQRMYEPADFDLRKEQFVAGLNEAGGDGKSKLVELFQDGRFTRTMIINRGKEGANHKHFLLGLEKLISSEADLNSMLSIERDDNLIEVIRGLGLPEDVISKAHEIYIHQRDIERAKKIMQLVSVRRASLRDDSVYYRALHNMATLDREEKDDNESALDKNSQIVEETRKENCPGYKIISVKAGVGTIWDNSGINDGQRAELLFKKAEEMKKLGSSEELRVRTGAVSFLADHAEKQYQDKDAQHETVKKAIEMAVAFRGEGKKLGYLSVEINALEALIRLNSLKYKSEMKSGTERKGLSKEAKIARDFIRRFGRQAMNLRQSTHYATGKRNTENIRRIMAETA